VRGVYEPGAFLNTCRGPVARMQSGRVLTAFFSLQQQREVGKGAAHRGRSCIGRACPGNLPRILPRIVHQVSRDNPFSPPVRVCGYVRACWQHLRHGTGHAQVGSRVRWERFSRPRDRRRGRWAEPRRLIRAWATPSLGRVRGTPCGSGRGHLLRSVAAPCNRRDAAPLLRGDAAPAGSISTGTTTPTATHLALLSLLVLQGPSTLHRTPGTAHRAHASTAGVTAFLKTQGACPRSVARVILRGSVSSISSVSPVVVLR